MDRQYLAQQINALFCLVGKNLSLSDSEKMQIADLYPPWTVGERYAADVIVKHGTNADGETQLWRVEQVHTSQSDWAPGTAPSLFTAIGFEDDGTMIWTQPLGSHDAYRTGDQVSYDGKLWVCTHDYNTYAPGVYGWEEEAG